MKKLFCAVIAALCVLFSGFSHAAKQPNLKEIYLGNKDAPVTMQEFASLTCSHCADFTVNVLPELKKKYIDTGKMRYIYRDFPIDGIALKAAALAHCMPDEQYYAFLDVLSKNQQQWAFGSSPERTLLQYAKTGGLAEEKAASCIKDPDKLDALVALRTEAQNKYDIDSTPTFIFNEGKEKIKGAMKVEDFSKVIDKLLEQKK